MRHLSDSAAVTIAEGTGSEQERKHAGECTRCQERVTRYRYLLDGLELAAELAAEPPDELLRWARACTRSKRPPVARTSWLQLLAFGAQPMAAVRSGCPAATAALFGNERYQIDLQVESLPAGGHQLMGQIVPLADDLDRIWVVEVVTAAGCRHRVTAESGGEFCIDELDSWKGLSMIATGDGERLLVPCLAGGDTDQGE